jgi:hypothetical protein|tara:strand:+ start:419 stop:544 length:126 start_codon:yes stop_codon:yes gene_type:complete
MSKFGKGLKTVSNKTIVGGKKGDSRNVRQKENGQNAKKEKS